MELEPNMYVRTTLGITKYLGKYENSEMLLFDKLDLELWSGDLADVLYRSDVENVILKSSHNVIDLIEVGDVITFKNDEDVYRVSCVPNEESACDCFYLVFNYATQYGVEDIEVSKEIMQNTLESVITREQFEKIAYKVGDDK